MVWKTEFFFLTAWYLAGAYIALLFPRYMGLGRLGERQLPVPHRMVARKVSKFIRFFVVGRKNYCVLHSITLCRLLRRYGLDLELNIVVTMQKDETGQRLRGHCWPALDGERYFDSAPDTDTEEMDLLARSPRMVNFWTEKTIMQT